MAHLYKKLKKGHEYFYIRETQRVYGKPTTINQVYLGTADKVEAALGKRWVLPRKNSGRFSPSTNSIDKVDMAGMINEILPPKKRVRGPSLGELVFYAALNRAISPTSKRQLATWYETTDIQRIRPLRLESLNSQISGITGIGSAIQTWKKSKRPFLKGSMPSCRSKNTD